MFRFKALFENQRNGKRTWRYINIGDAPKPEWGSRVTEWIFGIEIDDKWYFDGDVLQNPCLSDLWIVRIEKGCFKVGLIPNSRIIKHHVSARYPYHSELLYDVTDVFDNIGNKWNNPELLEVGE